MATQGRGQLGTRYRLWVAGTTVSEVGDDALYFALGWTAAAYGGVAAGWVLAAITAPRVALTLVGGVVTDRLGPRAVVVAAQSGLLLATLATAATALVVGTPLWLLLTFAAALGVATAFLFPSTNTLVARVVDPETLPRALSLRQLGFHVASLAGGPAGGLLVAAGGLALVLWTNSATFLLALGAVLLLRPPRPTPAAPGGSLLGGIADGLRIAWSEGTLRTVLGLYALTAGCALPVGSLLVPLLARERAWPSGAAGVVVGAVGLGAAAVALAIARLGVYRRTGAAIAVGLTACGGAAVLLAVAPAVWVAAAAGAVLGAGLAMFIAHGGPAVVAHSPDTHLARVSALLGLVQSGALIATNPLLGALAQLAAPATATIVAGGMLLLGAALAASSGRLGTARAPA
jgi:hypothetical protein